MNALARAGRLGLALTALVAGVPACGSDSAPPPPVCPAGRAADGSFVLALGGTCLRGVTMMVRSGGSFRAATAADGLELADAGGGAVILTASAAPPVEAFQLTLPGVAGDAILQQGYQSWSFSGAVQVPAAVSLNPDNGLQLVAPIAGDPLFEAPGVSYGSAVIGTHGGPFLIAGALGAERATTGIAAVRAAAGKGADVTILYGALREALPADTDGKVRSEGIYLAATTDAGAGLAGLAAAMKAALPAGSITAKRPPGGWFSWNQLFDQVDEPAVKKHIDLVAQELLPLGLPLVEIDDGWEQAWGDWTANARFPDGMGAVGAAITGKGLVAGVWLAPFLVDVTSATGKATDPSLFVQSKDGGPLIHEPEGNPNTFFVLDGTNPASMKIAVDAIASLRGAGFRYFKLDFLYAGALPGVRSQKEKTANQALRSGLEMLRAAAGADGFINACGAPILPVLGVADSLRVGSDTAFSALKLGWPFITFAARSVAARGYLSPIVWPDADQAQLRAPYTADEARAAAVVAALAGPAYSLGDDLTALDPARLALGLDPEVIDLAGAAAPATPDDLFAAPAADIVKSPALDSVTSVAPPPPAFTAVGKSGARYAVTFSWGDPHGVTVTKKP